MYKCGIVISGKLGICKLNEIFRRYVMDIKITKAAELKPKYKDASTLGFGKMFTDHMFIMEYTEGEGWQNPRIEPYHRLALDPSSSVLHYAQEIFEGLKAYKDQNGKITMFRPIENCRRLNNSAKRLCMPTIDEDLNMAAMKALVSVERDWIPTLEGTSLYLRPTMIANDEALGVHAAKNYIYYIIASPSGAYYKEGLAPVNIKIEEKYIRAVRGGMGEAKTGGNYAASIRAGEEAGKEGYAQVLWLDGEERKYIEEVGAMNMMFVINNTIITPELDGSILPGITRKSTIELARSLGYKVEERKVSVAEVMDAARSGALTEAFGTGTAAVISPVGMLAYKDEKITLGNGEIGKISQQLYDTLTGIQRGKIEDKFGWITVVE